MRTKEIKRTAGGAVALALVVCASMLAVASDLFGVAASGQARNPSAPAPAQQLASRPPTTEEVVEEVRRAVQGIDPKQFDGIRDARLRKAYKRTHARMLSLVATRVDRTPASKLMEELDRALAAQEQEEARAGFTHGDCTSAFNKCQNDCPGLFCGCRLQRMRCTWKASKNYFPE